MNYGPSMNLINENYNYVRGGVYIYNTLKVSNNYVVEVILKQINTSKALAYFSINHDGWLAYIDGRANPTKITKPKSYLMTI